VNAVLLVMIGLVALPAGVAHIINFWQASQIQDLADRLSDLEARRGLDKQPSSKD
jgi:hypothetical protein